jgi:hypothetical protein
VSKFDWGSGRFAPWQWRDIFIVLVLVWAQVVLSLTWGKDLEWAPLLVGVLVLAMVVKAARWMVPMLRDRWPKK